MFTFPVFFILRLLRHLVGVAASISVSMERILAVTDIFNFIGSYTVGDDTYRIRFTAWFREIWQRLYQDRMLTLSLQWAFMTRTPSPEPEDGLDGDGLPAPPTPTPPSSPSPGDWWYIMGRRRYPSFDGDFDRHPDSPFSDPFMEMERQDDCWGC